MNEQKKTKGAKWFGIPNLVPYMRPYGKLIFWMVLMAFYGSAMDAVIPLFQQYAIDHYIADSTLAGLGWFIGAYVVVILTQTASNYISAFGACKLELSVGRDLKRESFNHLQTLSFSYFNQNSVGYVHARVMSDTDRIASTLAWSMAEGVWHSAYLVCAIVMMLILNWKMALCVLVIVPIVAISSMYFQKKLVFFHRQVREKNSRITGAFNEGITGARTTKTLVTEEQTADAFRSLTRQMHDSGIRAARLNAVFIPLVLFFGTMAVSIVLLRGGYMVLDQALELATLSAFTTYAVSIFDPIQMTAANLAEFISLQASIERVTDLMDEQPQIQDTPEVIEKYGDAFHPKRENWEPLRGEIEFRDVTFRYPDGGENVLEHFSLHIPQGTTVAIVGETGAGKSTLINLACRFFEPTEGHILIDGVDYRRRSQLWLHSNIGYVLQNPHLFSGSVRENIRYGKLDATDEEVEAAARAVSADTVVSKLEKGWDSDVGEGGDRLSTGEKQLISFARAVLADPRIFVLDEATSSIDTQTEQLIQNAIDHLLTNRTSFLVAHRLSTIRKADVILVVKDGHIVEQGKHEELLRRKGYYHDLYSKQFAQESAARILGEGSAQ